MFNLVIDIGNTHAKLAVFHQQEMIHYQRSNVLDIQVLEAVLRQFPLENFTISNVRNDAGGIIKFLQQKLRYYPFSADLKTDVVSRYTTPETLGLDRWAKVIASYRLYPGRSSLMIDAGTCITYDVLSKGRVYEGGSISPGIRMRFEALHTFTGKLPKLNWAGEYHNNRGRTTEEAITGGVTNGILQELKGIIATENEKNEGLLVLLTGGDADFLTEQLKNSIFARQIIHEPYLVLKGLNEVITL